MPADNTIADQSARLSKSEVTRARIIEAAGKVLAETGYQHTRLSAIADAAGMQAGSLYYYFDSKDQLVEEALAGATRAVHVAVQDAIDLLPDAPAGERLFAAMRSFITTRLELGAVSPAHIRNYRDLPDAMRERLRPEMEEVSRLWNRLVRDAVADGEIRGDIDPDALHLFVYHTSEQIAKWPPPLKESISETTDVMFRLMLNGIVGP